jgi:hypothetical protein
MAHVHLVNSSSKLGFSVDSLLCSGIVALGAGNSDSGAERTALGWCAIDGVVKIVCPFAIDVASRQTGSTGVGRGSGSGSRGALLYDQRDPPLAKPQLGSYKAVASNGARTDWAHGCIPSSRQHDSQGSRRV